VKVSEIPIFRAGEERAPAVALRGDISTTNFWSTGTEAIFDVRFTDTDNASYRTQDLTKVLKRQEEEKKAKYSDACREAHLHFTPLVFFCRWHGGQRSQSRSQALSF